MPAYLLYIPPGVAVVSLLFTGTNALITLRQKRHEGTSGESLAPCNQGVKPSKAVQTLGETIRRYDGIAIILLRVLRLLLVSTLLGLEVFHSVSADVVVAAGPQITFYIYLFLLASLSIISSTRWRDIASLHLTFLLLLEFTVYFILDIWPCMTLRRNPFDPFSDPVTWTRVTLLTLAAIVIPLTTPRPFRSVTPGSKPGLEETAPLLSRLTFNYLNRIVFLAWRTPHVDIEEMPEVPERRKVEALGKRGLKSLDPVLLGRKRHAFWGFLTVWGFDYFRAFTWLTLHSLAKFIGVLGTQYLLSYLETGLSPFGLQPWVWILLVGLGPSLSAYLLDQHSYIGTRINVENSSFLSYLVFHHVLRIRLKSSALDGDKMKDNSETIGPSSKASATLTEVEVEGELAEGEEFDAGGEAPLSEPAPEGGHVKEKTSHLVGKINNLITTDLAVIENSYTAVQLPSILLQIVVAIILLYQLLGWSSLVGFALMVILTPLPTRVGQLIVGVQKERMIMTDKRVQSVTETLGILRMVKLFAWEAFVLKELIDRRVEELKKIRKGRILELLMSVFSTTLPLIAKVTTVAIYVLVIKGNLTPSRIFAALMVFSILEEQIFRFTHFAPKVLQAKVSYDRYTDFLNNTELLDDAKESAGGALGLAAHDENAIGFNNCTFSWDLPTHTESDGNNGHTRKEFRLCFGREVLFKQGEINLIAGPTASGKTSVLMALLGEMYYEPHGPGSWYNLPRNKGIAYAPQESWVLNETIRDNILFGELYDERRYKLVIEQCALEHDLSLWDAGDLTEVGEKGVTLSGGQKARVTLARALYSSAAILLLDDILAALDVHTAKWIVEKVFQGELVKGRTIILVTNNVALVAPIIGFVLLLGRHGNVLATGTVAEVLEEHAQLGAQVEKSRENIEDIKTKTEETDKEPEEGAKQAAGKLVVAEEKALGRVEVAALMLFVRGVGKPFVWLAIIFALIAAMLVSVFQTWFIGYWSSQYETHYPFEVPVVRYLLIYAFLNVFTVAVDFTSQVLWMERTLRASKTIYFQLLESIVSATFRWLDITPVGRIIARCTQDIGNIDDQFTAMTYGFLELTAILTITFVSSILMAGWSAFIPGLILLVVGTSLGFVYLKCQICVRREMSNAKAPVMSQISTVLNGLPSIRAYGAQKLFASELKKRIDVLTRASLTYYDINRWVSIRINILSGMFCTVVAAYLVYGGRLSAGAAGFTISVVTTFSRNIIYWVRLYNLVEIQANSLERILEFLRIDHEPKPSNDGLPPAYWPSSGSLRAENLSARYSDDSPEVLKDISFEIKPGERIGIVGRTGAGKSSVALALLRAIKTSGKVYYDSLPTDQINLDALRANITLIPQQPELIHGSLRTNLDPFAQHDDATLYEALRVAGLFDIHEAVSEPSSSAQAGFNGSSSVEVAKPKIGLDTIVENGGTNFSLGQRQIIALARAIIRRSKLLILDEATAAIDHETDAAIQRALRTEFDKETTFITIAHRLQTILDYDRIMVLDSGRLVEFDTPKTLLKNEKGFLRALVENSHERSSLWEIVNRSPDA